MAIISTRIKILSLIIFVLSLSSCAVILSGSRQKVTITSCPENADVYWGKKHLGKTPLNTKLKRKYKKEVLTIKKEGFITVDSIPKQSFNMIGLLDLCFAPIIISPDSPSATIPIPVLFLPALAIDAAAGAFVKYPGYYNLILKPENKFNINCMGCNENQFRWDSAFKLTPKMFRGIENGDKNFGDIKVGAAISSTISYAYIHSNDSLLFSSWASFFINKSWMDNKSKEVLNHEQRHFDIAEIYTRKFVMELDTVVFSKNGYKNEIDLIYKKYVDKLNSAQKDYDDQTEHGMNKEIQKEWDRMINEWLNKSKGFYLRKTAFILN